MRDRKSLLALLAFSADSREVLQALLGLELVGDVARDDDRTGEVAFAVEHRLGPGVDGDPVALGVARPIAQMQVGHRARHHADEQRGDVVEVVGVDEVEHVATGEHLVAMAEQRALGLADLMDLPGPVHQGDHVRAGPDDRVEQAVPGRERLLRTSSLGRVRGDPADGERGAGLVADEEAAHHEVSRGPSTVVQGLVADERTRPSSRSCRSRRRDGRGCPAASTPPRSRPTASSTVSPVARANSSLTRR